MSASFNTQSKPFMKYSNDDISLGKRSVDDNFMTVLPRIIDPTLGLTHVRKDSEQKSTYVGPKQEIKPTPIPEKRSSVSTTESTKEDSPQSHKSSNIKYYIILFISILITGVVIYFIYKYFQKTANTSVACDDNAIEKPPELCFSKQDSDEKPVPCGDNSQSTVLENLSKYINMDNADADTDFTPKLDTVVIVGANSNGYLESSEIAIDMDQRDDGRIEIIEEKHDAEVKHDNAEHPVDDVCKPYTSTHNVELEQVDVGSISNVPMLEHTMDTLLEEHSDCSSFDEDECKVDIDILDTADATETTEHSTNEDVDDDVMDVFKRYSTSLAS